MVKDAGPELAAVSLSSFDGLFWSPGVSNGLGESSLVAADS